MGRLYCTPEKNRQRAGLTHAIVPGVHTGPGGPASRMRYSRFPGDRRRIATNSHACAGCAAWPPGSPWTRSTSACLRQGSSAVLELASAPPATWTGNEWVVSSREHMFMTGQPRMGRVNLAVDWSTSPWSTLAVDWSTSPGVRPSARPAVPLRAPLTDAGWVELAGGDTPGEYHRRGAEAGPVGQGPGPTPGAGAPDEGIGGQPPSYVPAIAILVGVLLLYGLSRWLNVRGELNRKRSLTQQRILLTEMSPEERDNEDRVARMGFFGQARSGTGASTSSALLAGAAVGAYVSE